MGKEDFILIELPMPPSLNKLFSGKSKRTKSEEYEGWIKQAMVKYAEDGIDYKIKGDEWLEVELNYFFSLYTKKGDKRIKDTANYEKATIDFLTTQIPGFEDHKIKKITQEKHDSSINMVKVLIKEIK